MKPRFTNSQSATDLSPEDRIVTAKLKTPYTSDEADLYGVNTANAAAASFVFTNGGYSTTFSIAKLQIPDMSPVVGGKGEITLEINGVAKKSGSTAELAVTHDSTA